MLADCSSRSPSCGTTCELGREWADLLFPPTAFDAADRDAQQDRLTDTRVAQPALGIGGLAVAPPAAAGSASGPTWPAGHSYGELVALCAAGAFDAGDPARAQPRNGRRRSSPPPATTRAPWPRSRPPPSGVAEVLATPAWPARWSSPTTTRPTQT